MSNQEEFRLGMEWLIGRPLSQAELSAIADDLCDGHEGYRMIVAKLSAVGISITYEGDGDIAVLSKDGRELCRHPSLFHGLCELAVRTSSRFT